MHALEIYGFIFLAAEMGYREEKRNKLLDPSGIFLPKKGTGVLPKPIIPLLLLLVTIDFTFARELQIFSLQIFSWFLTIKIEGNPDYCFVVFINSLSRQRFPPHSFSHTNPGKAAVGTRNKPKWKLANSEILLLDRVRKKIEEAEQL